MAAICEKISEFLLQRAHVMYREERLCDVTILIREAAATDEGTKDLGKSPADYQKTRDSMECHSLVLGAFSEVLLEHMMQQGRAYKVVAVSGYNVETIRVLMHYMYTGLCELTDTLAIELVRLSCEWKIACLKDHVIKYMEHNVTVRNCALYYDAAVTLGISSLKQAAQRNVVRNFSQIFHECRKWSFESMSTLFSTRFNVETEDIKMVCLLNWAEEHSDETHVEDLIRNITVKDLSERMVETCYENNVLAEILQRIRNINVQEISTTNGHALEADGAHVQACSSRYSERTNHRDVSADAIDSEQSVAVRRTPTQPYKQSRSQLDTRTDLYPSMDYESIGLTSLADMSSLMTSWTGSHSCRLVALHKNHYIYYFSHRRHKWRALMKKPTWVSSMSSWCTTYNGLVVIGGDDPAIGCSVSVLDLIKKDEKRLHDLPHPVKAAGVICIEDQIFVIGGAWHNNTRWTTQNFVYSFSIKPGHTQWKLHGRIEEPVCWPIVRHQAGAVYVIGGTDNRGVCVTHVQRYDIQTRTCTLLHALPHSCNDITSGAVLINYDDYTDCVDNPKVTRNGVLERDDASVDSGIVSGAASRDYSHEDANSRTNGFNGTHANGGEYGNADSLDYAMANGHCAMQRQTAKTNNMGQILVYTKKYDMKYTIGTNTWVANETRIDAASKNALMVNDLVHVTAWFNDNKRECYHHNPATDAYTQVPSMDMSACVHCYYLYNVPIR